MSEQTPESEFVPRYNGYKCGTCGLCYLTRDVGEGATPAFMTCFRTEGCMGRCVSMGYPKGDPPKDLPLLIEFYKPSRQQIRKTKHPGLKDHFLRGGLARRALPDAPDWVKKLA